MATATIQHMRILGLCNKGLRRWFDTQGISWNDVVYNGVDTAYLRSTGNAVAIAVAELAEEELKSDPELEK